MALRLDNVGIVVEDLAAAVELFHAMGMELEGRGMVEGEWAGRVTVSADDRPTQPPAVGAVAWSPGDSRPAGAVSGQLSGCGQALGMLTVMLGASPAKPTRPPSSRPLSTLCSFE